MRRPYYITLLLAAITLLTACGNEEINSDPVFNEEVTMRLMEKSKMPNWLVEKIDYLENSDEGLKYVKAEDIKKSGVYRFEWNHKTYYEFFFPRQSTLHEYLYNADGVPLELTDQDYEDLGNHAKNWTIIYIFFSDKIKLPNRRYNLEPVEQNVIDFFESHCSGENLEGFLFDEQAETECYIVNDIAQLLEIYDGKQLGKLYDDRNLLRCLEYSFFQCSYIIGKTCVPENSVLVRQNFFSSSGYFDFGMHFKNYNEMPYLNLHFEKKQHVGQEVQDEKKVTYYFWGYYGIYNNNKEVDIKLFYNNREEPEQTFTTKLVVLPPRIK